MSINYVDPVAETLVKPNPYSLSVALDQGTRLALVANAIVDCDKVLEAVGSAIAARCPGVETTLYRTGSGTFAPAEKIDQIVNECDAAVCAIGHCGSCTAGTVKDGVAFITRGVPAVSLVTEIFWEQANALAQSLGWPDAPRVMLPYPVWGTGEDAIAQVAETVVNAIIDGLERPDAKAA